MAEKKPAAQSDAAAKPTLDELKAELAALPPLTVGQRIRVFVRLHTSPRFLWLYVKRAYYRVKSIYFGALIYIYFGFGHAILAAVRPAYRPYEVIIPAFLILFGGIFASVSHDDWTWFARSGSLLVIVAALMHVYDAKAWIEKSKTSILEALEIFLSQLDVHGADEKYAEFIDPLRRSANAGYRRIKRYDMDRLSQTYKRYEIIAAILGTIVWGFGDLVGKFLLGG